MDKMLDFSKVVSPEEVGMRQAGIDAIGNLFEEMFAKGWHSAAQLVVARSGKMVFDRLIGSARGRPVSANTPFMIFSSVKAVTAICLHKLIEQGKVEIDAPIAEYWPEFGQKGKQSATIRHVFLHQAGIPSRGLNRQTFLWPSWKRVTRSVANLPAEYPPGSKVAYHLVNYGFIFGEVVRRVTGMGIDLFFEQQFAQPLGLKNTWYRIPSKQLKRSPRLISLAKDQNDSRVLFNLPIIRKALVPAAVFHSTARELAIFYQMLLNGGEFNGKRMLQPETIAAATAEGYRGWDDLVQVNVVRGYGFHLGGNPPQNNMPGPVMGSGATVRTYGHYGNRSILAWADPEHELVVTFLCNGLLDYRETRQRWTEISNAVWDALG